MATLSSRRSEEPAVCECGHFRDEHHRSSYCTIEDCPCACFEPDYEWSDPDDNEALHVKTWGLP